MSNFLQTSGFKWIDLKEFDLNKYISNSSKECANDYPLAPDKIGMLSDYQLKLVIFTIFLLIMFIN